MKQLKNNLIRAFQFSIHFGRPWCLLPLLLGMVWTGCGSNQVQEINPVGTYALVSVDGKKVPCAVTHEGNSLTVKSGTFIINADGTCATTTVFTVGDRPDISKEVKATYTRSGAKLTMKWQGAGMTLGTVEGDTFSMNNEGMMFSYRK